MPDATTAEPASAVGSLRPAEMADALGVSPATLRRWSQRFEPYLQARGVGADGSHRRYTAGDLETLRTIKRLLEAGWTYEQVAQRLDQDAAAVVTAAGSGDSTAAGAEGIDQELGPGEGQPGPAGAEAAAPAAEPVAAPRPAGPGQSLVTAESQTLSTAAGEDQGWPPAAQLLRDALQAVSDNQQVLLSAQYAHRDLMGVVIQDNLNLKDENAGLRERMLELERELAEMRRHQSEWHERLETRVRVLEDAVSTLMAARKAPPPTPPPTYPSAPQAPGPTPPYAPPPERRSFWSRLLGG